jgi:GNAT superfamily N-acetyltransferase
MVGNIYGDGPRGGVFGARIDPRLVAELEKRAADRRSQMVLEGARGRLDPAQIPPRNPDIPIGEGLAGTAGEMLYGVPVAGPALLGAGERMVAGKHSLMEGMPYSQALEEAQTRQENFRRDQPRIAESAQAGGQSLLAPAFGASMGAQVVGNAALSGADAMVRGEDPRYAAGEAALAAMLPIPGARAALRKGMKSIEVGGVKLPLNPDGTVTLYHGTTEAGEAGIRSSGRLTSGAEPDVYLTTAREGTGYGDRSVPVRVDPKLLQIDDEFPGGRADFRLPSGSAIGFDAFDFSPGYRSTKIVDTEISYTVGKDGAAEIDLVKTPKEKRGQGSARSAMQAFLSEADANGVSVRLTADPMEGGVSKSRLERFYKELGFKPNTGRNKDFTTRAGMIRDRK